jgi:hypothetical protein
MMSKKINTIPGKLSLRINTGNKSSSVFICKYRQTYEDDDIEGFVPSSSSKKFPLNWGNIELSLLDELVNVTSLCCDDEFCSPTDVCMKSFLIILIKKKKKVP